MDYREELYGELYHHGVKGQKWGVRRYQNPDGTLTAEGQKRYTTDKEGKALQKADQKLNKYSTKSTELYKSAYAKATNKDRDFGDKMFGRTAASDYYNAQRFEKKANKINEKYNNGKDIDKYKGISKESAKAGERFIERSTGSKVGLIATDAAITAGLTAVSAMVGLPVTLIYTHSAGDYKYKVKKD